MARKKTLQSVLSQRGAQYGDWCALARVTQQMRDALRASPGWVVRSASEREALEGAALKLARIANAPGPVKKDSWDDAIGFLTLGRDRRAER